MINQEKQMSNYGLDPEKKAFSYTREELFNCITKIVSHPHSVVTSHDQSRALAVMLVFEDYFSNFLESDNNGSHYVYERDELDFEDFVRFKLNLEYYHPVDADEVLK
jgi:hypothetical protein